MSVTLVPDFTAVSFGARRATLALVAGPSTYTSLSAGTAPAVATNGQAITASMFGLQYLDAVFCCADQTGHYTADFIPGKAGPNEVTSGILVWRAASGTIDEVTGSPNLSTYAIRVLAIGR